MRATQFNKREFRRIRQIEKWKNNKHPLPIQEEKKQRKKFNQLQYYNSF
jgi:hypothetical protein